MRRSTYIGLFFLLSALGVVARHNGDSHFSSQYTLQEFLSTNQYSPQSIKVFEAFLKNLDQKQASFKNEQDFIQYIFFKTHRRFLKNYSANASLDKTFDDGSYNCLTGTVLLSLILHHYNINHEVIETNYHIFITAETQQGKVLLETTDPINGFVNSTHEIENRIKVYKQNEIYAQQEGKSYYKFRFALFNSLTLNELHGLLYYNMAVNSFNNQNLQQAVQYFAKAGELYASERINEFSQVLLLSLQQSELELKTKENCMKTILLIRQKSLPVIIAAN